jgi:hypothetical protein
MADPKTRDKRHPGTKFCPVCGKPTTGKAHMHEKGLDSRVMRHKGQDLRSHLKFEERTWLDGSKYEEPPIKLKHGRRKSTTQPIDARPGAVMKALKARKRGG